MTLKHLRIRQNHMATTFDFTVSAGENRLAQADALLLRCHEKVRELECDLSEYIAASAVARFNALPANTPIAAPPSVLELLDRSKSLSLRTQGAFNCMAKSKIPGGVADLMHWDSGRGEIIKLVEGAHLGFGAIGKGFALDETRKLLEQEGFRDYILNAGGSSILLSGFASPGVPWNWAWSWRKDGCGNYFGIELCHASGDAIALGVSGIFEQGKHVLDPRTGAGVEHLHSALVGHASAASADALSTALFVLGWEAGMRALPNALDEPALAVIDQQDIPAWNGRFRGLWGNPAALNIFIGFLFLFSAIASADSGSSDQAVDLSSLGLSSFTPYIFERNEYWILLPISILLIVIAHLPFRWNRKKTKQ